MKNCKGKVRYGVLKDVYASSDWYRDENLYYLFRYKRYGGI